ncbi:hypothetical protein [Enterococcus sp. DIV0170]|uniref:hypothetical protein n=1 Tax=Enterococcus sp. DIV0170 TaxID=2774642 RepID=UPI003F23B348
MVSKQKEMKMKKRAEEIARKIKGKGKRLPQDVSRAGLAAAGFDMDITLEILKAIFEFGLKIIPLIRQAGGV